MKKVAVVWSSPNTDGLTASAKEEFVRGLTEAGAQVEEIHLNRKKLEHCRACGNGWGTCNKKGSCVIKLWRKTHMLACGMKATFISLDKYIEIIYNLCI